MTTLEEPPARAGRPGPTAAPLPEDRGGPTMPAGRVLGVLVFGLLLAALLNAPAIARKSKGEVGNPEWRVSVAEGLETVSAALFLDTPREAIDSALGKNQSSDVGTDELLDERGLSGEERADGPAGTGSETAEEVTTTTVPTDDPPEIRTPTRDKPLRLWVGGDSLSDTLSASVKTVWGSTGIFEITTDPRVSTGLTRPDYFNWPEHLAKDVIPIDPSTKAEPAGFYEVMIIVFGANDSQNIEKDGAVLERLTPEWIAEYRKRVADTMDLMRHREDERVVIWVGQPIMGPSSGVKGMDILNRVYYEEAAKRPWVVYFDSWPFFADSGGNYADQLPAKDGTLRKMRQPDKVHFSTSGGNRLSWAMLNRLGVWVDLAAWGGEPDPSYTPPTDVAERTEPPPLAPEVGG